MRILLAFTRNALALILKSHMSVEVSFAPSITSARSAEPLRQKKLLRSYLEVVSYFFTKVAHSLLIAKIETSNLRYTQPVSTTLMQYTDDL